MPMLGVHKSLEGTPNSAALRLRYRRPSAWSLAVRIMEHSQYKITSRDYLSRARICLDEGSNRFLFYAAFELRCGIEARMREYLEVWER